MNGFVVIGDKELIVSFETEEGRTGLFSDSPGMMQLFENFFHFRLRQTSYGRGPESLTTEAAE